MRYLFALTLLCGMSQAAEFTITFGGSDVLPIAGSGTPNSSIQLLADTESTQIPAPLNAGAEIPVLITLGGTRPERDFENLNPFSISEILTITDPFGRSEAETITLNGNESGIRLAFDPSPSVSFRSLGLVASSFPIISFKPGAGPDGTVPPYAFQIPLNFTSTVPELQTFPLTISGIFLLLLKARSKIRA